MNNCTPTKWITRELDKVLGTHELLKLTHEEIENLNRPVTNKDIESVIKTSERKAQDQIKSLVKSTKNLTRNKHQFF